MRGPRSSGDRGGALDGPTAALVELVTEGPDPGEVLLHAVVRNLVDTVACAAAGFDAEPPRLLRRIAERTRGEPGSSALGLERPVLVEYAVLANTASVRYCDWNDGGLKAGHPSDTIPAILALAEARDRSPRELLGAIDCSYRVLGALGADTPLLGTGWDLGFNISLAAAAGISRVLRLSPDATANAISLALTPSIPLHVTRTGQLSHWKSVATAHAAATATLACRLAEEGLTGPPRVFEGIEGVFEKVTGPFELVHLEWDGETSPSARVAHKEFPAVMDAQGPIALMLALRERVGIEEIKSVLLHATDLAWIEGGGGQGDAATRWDPQTRETADHSLPYLMARALADGTISLESFTPDRVRDPALRPLMARIAIVEDAEFTRRRRELGEENARVEVELRDGVVLREEITFPHGHHRNPMSDDELTEKLDRNAARVLPREARAALAGTLWSLADAADLTGLCALLRAFRG